MEIKQECPVPAGIVVIIGGKEKKDEKSDKQPSTSSDEVLEAVYKLNVKKGASIMVVTTGSSEAEEMFADYRKVFSELGPEPVVHVHHDDRAMASKDNSLLSKTREAGIFFFTGGDQLLLTSIYGGTPFLTLLKERYIAEKIVIAGTSAGAMALSTPMIYAGNEEVQQTSGEIKVTTGLEFLKDVCVDTHFVHRARFIRLAQVIATNPGCTGLGVEEDTAIIIRNGLDAEVAGSGTIIRIEGFNIVRADMQRFAEKKPFSVQNLKVDIYAPGEKFRIEQRNPPHK